MSRRRLDFIITAGPTREHLDPVRFLSNPSTGKMGFAVARAARARGHAVTLIAGPVALKTPKGVRRIDVTNAREMRDAVLVARDRLPNRTRAVLVATAAVADWRPATCAPVKLKKSAMSGSLRLVRNPDILREVTGLVKIGFAAETGDPTREAVRKCREKGLSLIVANDVASPGSGFGTDTNRVTFVRSDGSVEPLPLMSKRAVAACLVRAIETLTDPVSES